MQLTRHFSVDEANALLPAVRRVFRVVRPLHARLLVEAAQLKAAGHRPDPGGRRSLAPLPPDARAQQEEIQRLARDIQTLLDDLTVLGIEVKSAEGLVDFRSKRAGRTVYLCWRWGEDEIAWFHPLDAGYRGRLPIRDSSSFQGDVAN